MAAFLDESIGFTDIPRVIEASLAGLEARDPDTLDDLLDQDEQARRRAREHLRRLAGRRAAPARLR